MIFVLHVIRLRVCPLKYIFDHIVLWAEELIATITFADDFAYLACM